jgi:CHAD domain-containing protein
MAKSTFEGQFRQNLRRVDKRLRVYLANPENEDNIHDVRVSIRRLDATFSLLPKKVRKRYRGSIEKYKGFLGANSNARDCDIIAGRLAALRASSMADLQEKKRTELAKAVVIARSLEKLRPMQPGRLDDKRTDKMASRLVGRIEKLLPATLSDGSKVDELHRMRRDFRKLRYIMDVLPPGCRKKCMRKLQKAIGKNVPLQEVQDLLGSIHDCDITIEYLRSKGAKQILDKEIANRSKLYQKFVRYMKK